MGVDEGFEGGKGTRRAGLERAERRERGVGGVREWTEGRRTGLVSGLRDEVN